MFQDCTGKKIGSYFNKKQLFMNTKWQALCPTKKIIAFNFPRYNSACPKP